MRYRFSEAETVEDLIKIQSGGGTHSIIDIDGISMIPRYRMATPVSEARLLDLFGTEKPTRTMVEALMPRFRDLIVAWMAVFMIVYKDEKPDEVFIYGITGD